MTTIPDAPQPRTDDRIAAEAVAILLGQGFVIRGEKWCAPQPSAPVGVEWLVEEWRKRSQDANICALDFDESLRCADELEAALAQQPAALTRCDDCHEPTGSRAVCESCADIRCDAVSKQPAAEVVVTRDDDGEIIRVTQGDRVIAATTHAGGKQPAAVDEAMVERVAVAIYASARGFSADVAREKWPSVEQKARFTGPARAALETEFAPKPGGSDNGR